MFKIEMEIHIGAVKLSLNNIGDILVGGLLTLFVAWILVNI